jgi:HAMP domain-containing protein
VRGIAQVVTAVANGDLKRKLTIESKGEIAELANTINAMTDTLAHFSDQVTTMAREVGVEGKLGGQANVPARRHLARPDGQRQPVGRNLTTQVRAIAEVSTAVTQGDLTRFDHRSKPRAKVAALKGQHQRDDPQPQGNHAGEQEQDWLKTNLARFSSMLQGQRDYD